jgi:uncharacterized protein (TIGR03067 family)
LITVVIAASSILVRAEAGSQADDLTGEWEMVGMVYRGTVQDPAEIKGGTIRIEKGKLFLRYKEWKKPVERTFDVRPETGTGEIDWTDSGGLHPGRYELKDGTLKIIFTRLANGPRPTGFDAEKDEDVMMYTLERAKK